MYGTIARMRVKPGCEEQLLEMGREHAEVIKGFVFEHIFRMDSDPQEVMLVVGFESKEAYRANAESPEQRERYEAYRALLASDPDWHDGEIISTYPG